MSNSQPARYIKIASIIWFYFYIWYNCFGVWKMNSKILKYLSFILIIIISGGILLSTFVFIRFNSIVQNFENGILIYSFFTLYICAVMLPILFRKKLKISRTIPLILIFCILSAALINAGAYNIVKNSVSAYSRQNWDNNANLRIYMIEDLEKTIPVFWKNRNGSNWFSWSSVKCFILQRQKIRILYWRRLYRSIYIWYHNRKRCCFRYGYSAALR